MPRQLIRLIDYVTDKVGEFDRNTWILIGIGLIVTAFVTMRGFGSRTNY